MERSSRQTRPSHGHEEAGSHRERHAGRCHLTGEGWFIPFGEEDVDQSDLNEAIREQAAAADAVLLGRVTFKEMRGFWPLQTNDQTGVTEYLNNVEKYVVSSTMKNPRWQHSIVLSGDVADNVRQLTGREV